MVGSCMISRLLPVSLWLSPYSIFLHSSHPRFFLISPLALIWPRTCPYFHSATARNISIHAVSIHHLHLSRDVILHNCPFFHSPRPLPLLYFSTLFLPHLFSTSCHCIPSTSLSSIHPFIIFITATASGSTEGLILSSHLTSPHQPVASPLHQNIFHPTSLYPAPSQPYDRHQFGDAKSSRPCLWETPLETPHYRPQGGCPRQIRE